MKSKSFFKALSWLLTLNLLIKPVWIFAIDRQVQNTVGNQVYGSYFALLNLSIVFLFIADAGLSNMMAQRIAGKMNTNGQQLLQLKMALLFLYMAVCCLAGWIGNISEWPILLYVILIQVLGSLFLFLRSFLISQQLFKTDAFFSVADKALMTLFCGVFIYGWWQPIQLEIFLQLQLGSITLVCFVLLFLLLKKKLIVSGQKENVFYIIRSTAPFAIIILLMGMHYRLDAFLLERIRTDGAVQAGIYATAYRLLDAANMVGYLTASFLVPFIARNKKDNQLVSMVINWSRHGLLLLAITISCFTFVFPSWLQQLLYHTNYSFNSSVIQLCLVVLPAYYIIHIYGSVLTALSGFKTFIIILLASVFINLSLNYLLIPLHGALGCCIAAVVSQYACAAGCFFFATKDFSFSRSVKPWLMYVTASGLLLIALSLLKSFIHSVWIILAVTVLLVVALAITRLKYLKTIFRSLIQQTNA